MNEVKHVLNGKVVTRDEFLASSAGMTPGEPPFVAAPSSWQQKAVRNLWVNPVDIPRAVEAARKEGVRVEFKPDGTPVFDSKRQYREYCEKVRGVFDMDAGYCDPQPQGLCGKKLEDRYLEAVEEGQVEPFKQEVVGEPE